MRVEGFNKMSISQQKVILKVIRVQIKRIKDQRRGTKKWIKDTKRSLGYFELDESKVVEPFDAALSVLKEKRISVKKSISDLKKQAKASKNLRAKKMAPARRGLLLRKSKKQIKKSKKQIKKTKKQDKKTKKQDKKSKKSKNCVYGRGRG